MPQSAAYSLAQTSDGYVWIGTQDGLARFDGKRFVVFTRSNTPQLTDEWVTNLAATQDGALWGTTQAGIFRIYDGAVAVLTGQDTTCATKPTSLWADADNSIWVGSATGRVCRFSKGKWQEIGPANHPAPVRVLRRSSSGVMWMGSTDSLWRFDGSWQKLSTGDGLPLGTVRCVLERSNGEILVGSTRGISVVEGLKLLPWGENQDIFRSVVSRLLEDKHGNLWVAGWPSGLTRVSPSGKISQVTPGGVTPSVLSLLEDREGNLWVGTAGQGALVFEDPPITSFSAAEGVSDKAVWSVIEDRDGAMWISTFGDGIRKLDRERLPAPVPESMRNRRTGALMQSANGDIWVGIVSGIARIAQGRVSEYQFDKNPDGRIVSALLEGDDGTIWVGTPARGLLRFQAGRFVPEAGYSERGVKTMLRAADGTIWVGGTSGQLFYLKGVEWKRFSKLLPAVSVFSIMQDPRGSLWATTEGAGVFRIRGARVDSVSVAQGLCSASNYSMMDDGAGQYWLSTAKGVVQIPIAEMEAVTDGRATKVNCIHRGGVDGMKNPECTGGVNHSACKARDGQLWVSTINGVVQIDPRKLTRKQFVPAPLLESLVIVEGARDVEFRYTAPLFRNPESLQLHYRLSGYEDKWMEGSTRFARFTNLPPGEYTFEVKARNSDGVEAPVAALAKFQIQPKFSETVWFYLLLGSAGVALLALGIQYRTRQIFARQALLERLVEERTAEARKATQAKSEFLANMSHEIRTPMSATIGTTDLLMEMDLPPEAKAHLATVRNSGEALLALINNILDFSKIEAGKLEVELKRFSLIECIEDSLALVAGAAQAKKLGLEDSIDLEVPEFIESDPTRLRQILLNLLSNAIKFTFSGSVRLQVSFDQDSVLTFIVQDSGIGIPPESHSRLFEQFSQTDSSTTRQFGGTGLGLAISKKLSEALGGRIWVDSVAGKGSTFHFTIQAKKPEFTVAPVSGDRILIQLNNRETEEGLRKRLLRLGYKDITTTPAAQEPFQFAFVDATFTGHDALRATNPELRVIVVAAKDAGLSGAVLLTPIRIASLKHLLGETAKSTDGLSESKAILASRFPLTLLLAEDNKVNQKVILRMLQVLGYEADLAENGIQVIDALRQKSYDLVFMDVHMPDMDGLEATRRICQEWPESRRPWILALTAGAFEDNRAECIAVGMNGFLAKPVRIAELAAAIESFAGTQRSSLL